MILGLACFAVSFVVLTQFIKLTEIIITGLLCGLLGTEDCQLYIFPISTVVMAAPNSMTHPSVGHTLVSLAMQWLVFVVLLSEVIKDDCTAKAFDSFLSRSHLLQGVMLCHMLVGVSYNWTWRSLYHLLQLYGVFLITWVFVLWSCNAYTFASVGVPLHVTTAINFLQKDFLVASMLSMVAMKATVKRTIVHFSRVGVSGGTGIGRRNGVEECLHEHPLIAYLPEASVCFILVALSSAVYLLDWHENWQLWPIPTVIAAFACSTVDDVVSLVRSRSLGGSR